ncbi:MAG: PAS domain S-box protein, partial [Nitrospiria bacterium]
MAGVGSALTLLGFFLSPPGGALSIVLLNRFLALFLIWAAAILTIQYKRKIEESTKSKVALHGSEAQYRSLVQTVGSVILYISPDHKIIEFNQEAERVYGRSREEVLGKDYFKLFLPEIVWDSVAADIRKVLAGEPTRGFENPVLTADGNERILLWNVVRMLDDQGEPIGFIACGQDITDLKQAEKELQKAKDEMEQRVNERTAELLQANKALGTEITERKQAEEALRTARKRLEYLISSSPTVIFTGNPVDYTTTFISENVTEMLGYESRQFLEDPRFWANHIHPEDAPRIFAEIGRLSEEGNCTLEYRFRHKNGTHRWMQDRLRLVRDKTDNAPEVIGAWWDITERKEAEEEIEASLKEKEILLQEVHHRVKNNLQIISSLLNLQLSTIKDQAAAAILLESRKRIKSMAIIHETLYRTKDLENVNLTKYIQNLTAQLFAASGINASAVTPKINANNLSMDIDTAIPCGLIINELVSNA